MSFGDASRRTESLFNLTEGKTKRKIALRSLQIGQLFLRLNEGERSFFKLPKKSFILEMK